MSRAIHDSAERATALVAELRRNQIARVLAEFAARRVSEEVRARARSLLDQYLNLAEAGAPVVDAPTEAIMSASADLFAALAPLLDGIETDFLEALEDHDLRARVERALDPMGAAPSGRSLGAATELPGLAGQIVGDRYELQERIGAGGMGVVYRATDLALRNRAVAVKILSTGPFLSEWHRREVDAVLRVSDPAIVDVYAAGVSRLTTALGPVKVPWIAMQLVPGARSIEDWAAATGRDPARILLAMAEIARAMRRAHAEGLIHRDLKPANLLMDIADEPRIIDFGIARVRTPADVDAEFEQGARSGTPAYMPPWNVRVSSVQADIYALGVVLFELLRGEPFHRALTRAAADRSALYRPLSDSLRWVLRRAIGLDEQAYPTMADFEHDLILLTRGDAPRGAPFSLRRWARRHPLAVAAAGVAIVPILVLALDQAFGWRLRARVRASFRAEQHEDQWQLAERGFEALEAGAYERASAAFDDLDRAAPGHDAARLGHAFVAWELLGPGRALLVLARWPEPSEPARFLADRIRAEMNGTAPPEPEGAIDPLALFALARCSRLRVATLSDDERDRALRLLAQADGRAHGERFCIVAARSLLLTRSPNAAERDEMIVRLEESYGHLSAAWTHVAALETTSLRYDQALRAYRHAKDMGQDDLRLHAIAIEALRRSGRPDEAQALVAALASRAGDDPLFLAATGALLYDLGGFEDAITRFRGVLRASPNFVEVLYNLGITFARLEQFPEAEETLSACLRLSPSYKVARDNLAILYNNWAGRVGARNEVALEIELLQQSLKVQPDCWEARLNLARAFRRAGNREAVAGECLSLLAQRPTHAEALTYLAEHHAFVRGDAACALHCLLLAVESDPTSCSVHTTLVSLCQGSGDRTSLIRELHRWLEVDPTPARASEVAVTILDAASVPPAFPIVDLCARIDLAADPLERAWSSLLTLRCLRIMDDAPSREAATRVLNRIQLEGVAQVPVFLVDAIRAEQHALLER